jgi:hypothetical protein
VDGEEMSTSIKWTRKQLTILRPAFRAAREAFSESHLMLKEEQDKRGVIFGQVLEDEIQFGFFAHDEAIKISKLLQKIMEIRRIKKCEEEK